MVVKVKPIANPMPEQTIRQVVFESIDLITTTKLNMVAIKIKKNAVLVFFSNSLGAPSSINLRYEYF